MVARGGILLARNRLDWQALKGSGVTVLPGKLPFCFNSEEIRFLNMAGRMSHALCLHEPPLLKQP